MRLEFWRYYETSYVKKTEVEVLPVVDLAAESASFLFMSDATQQVGIYFAHIKLLLCCGEADTLLNPHDLATDHRRCHYECYEISKLPGTRYNLRTA